MTDDAIDTINYLRRWHRREYLRRHEKERRADLKAEGARRIDVTLRGETLDDHETVRRYIEGIERWISERARNVPPRRRKAISDTEVIKTALSRAASSIREDDDRAAKCGGFRFLE